MSASRRLRRSPGNYAPKVLALARKSDLAPGQLAHVTVAHDRRCGVNRGRRCDCDPDVKLAGPGAGGPS